MNREMETLEKCVVIFEHGYTIAAKNLYELNGHRRKCAEHRYALERLKESRARDRGVYPHFKIPEETGKLK